MDSYDRENMASKVNAAPGGAVAVDTIQRRAGRIRDTSVNRKRRPSAKRQAITKVVATKKARPPIAVESITFWCNVLILKVISSKPWYYFSCALCKCMKGVKKIRNIFMCSSCEAVCSKPILRYSLHLEVTNGISTVMITLFDEVAERMIKKPAHDLLPNWDIEDEPFALPAELNTLHHTFHVMELKSHTYYDQGTYESFACSGIFQLIPGMKLGIVALDATGLKTSDVQNVSDLLPQLSAQLNLNSADQQSNSYSDTSLTELLLLVRRHLKLGGQLHNNSVPIAFLNSEDPTITQPLYIGRQQEQQNQESTTFACKVLIKAIRPQTTWCYLACDECKSNEGLTDVGGTYWCGVCASICKVQTIRYHLQMDVTHGGSSIVVIFQNNEGEALLKQPACQLLADFQDAKDFYQIPREIQNLNNTYHFLEFQTHTYIDHHEYESFVCNRVLRPGSSMKLGIILSPKRTLPYSEVQGAQVLEYYREDEPNTGKAMFVSAAKESDKKKRRINESSKKRINCKTISHSLTEKPTGKHPSKTEKETSPQQKDAEIVILSESDSC